MKAMNAASTTPCGHKNLGIIVGRLHTAAMPMLMTARTTSNHVSEVFKKGGV
jgi:hypothetical protein